jgi:hypothetical protein
MVLMLLLSLLSVAVRGVSRLVTGVAGGLLHRIVTVDAVTTSGPGTAPAGTVAGWWGVEMAVYAAVLFVAGSAFAAIPSGLLTMAGLEPEGGVASWLYLLVTLDAAYLVGVALDALLEVGPAGRSVTLKPGYVVGGWFAGLYAVGDAGNSGEDDCCK